MEVGRSSLSYHIQRRNVVNTIQLSDLDFYFFTFREQKMSPPELRKKRRVIVEEEETEGGPKSAKKTDKKLISEIALRCSKQTKIEVTLLASASASAAAEEEVSLDEIKRLYGVDPTLMRARHDALENESKFSNPRNAYLNISETPSPHSPTPTPPSAPSTFNKETAPPVVAIVNKKSKNEQLVVPPSPAPSSSPPSSQQSWQMKNKILYEKWKQKIESETVASAQFLSLKQRTLNISVSYQQHHDSGTDTGSDSDTRITTRPFQSLVSWYAGQPLSLSPFPSLRSLISSPQAV
jgi:hypothetical protein